jgi:2-haloacid dehalogenase
MLQRTARPPRVLLFDVFGTVVDWRGSIIRELRGAGRRLGLKADWDEMADAWRAGYRPAMDRVRSGEQPWRNIDTIHREILANLLSARRVCMSKADVLHLNAAWHRLRPWPDAVAGLKRLKRRFVIGTLSNGNVALLVDVAKSAGLPWDCVLSAEMFQGYKPDRKVYLGAAALMGVAPRELMLVAAHKDDLAGGRACGLQTAFVRRPFERGPKASADLSDDARAQINADDFVALAEKLGA